MVLVGSVCECRYEEKLENFCKLMDFVIDSSAPELRHQVHFSIVAADVSL